MGISERKMKEKIELKALILDAARKLFIERGIDETSIRNIAEAIEYSPATIYLYFRDKDEILHEIHTQGFMELSLRMEVLQSVSDPLERLKALGRVYIDYALQNTGMYDLMFIAKAPMSCLEKMHQQEWNEGQKGFDFLKATIVECIAAGRFQGHQPEPLAFMVWSCVHGMVALEIRERCKGIIVEKPDDIFREGFESFLRILEAI